MRRHCWQMIVPWVILCHHWSDLDLNKVIRVDLIMAIWEPFNQNSGFSFKVEGNDIGTSWPKGRLHFFFSAKNLFSVKYFFRN